MSKKWIFSAVAAGGLAIVLAAPAAAHVTVQPGEATQGGYTAFAFRVPNERPDAGTVKIEVTLPADHPIGSVRTKPMTGWTAKVVKQGNAVRTVTWTAQPGVRINPDEFQEFEVAAGPLPEDTDTLVLATKQSYDNGEVVAWDAPPVADGAAEPEHPAPVLELQPAAAEEAGHDEAGHGDPAAPTVTGATEATHGTDSTARLLGGAGLVLGALGLGFGAGAVLRLRRGKSA
ncbi:MAG: YcnI family protein [Pseudonocardiaceae bacterium]